MIRWLALAFALLLSACSFEPPPTPVIANGKGAPALWKITSKDSKGGAAYLFGSVHQLPPDTDWQTPELDAAIRASNGLVIEVLGLDDGQAIGSIFAQMGVRKGLPPLADRIEPSLRPQFASLVDKGDLPAHVLDNMESWAAALTLASASSVGLGVGKEWGVETILQRRFTADEKTVSGLETVEQQFGYFDDLPEIEQRKLLSLTIMEAGKASANYQDMLDDWMAGKSDDLLMRANEGLLASPVIREALLDGRNRHWTNQIAAMIDDGKRPFIAVGAGHLAGAGGVPALLAAKGYAMQRIQ